MGTDQVDLTWDPIGDADTYTIYRDGQPLTDTTQASHTDTGLTPTTEYTYTLTATNPSGTSEASEPVAATTDAPPPPPVTPTGLTATAVGTDQVDLTWDPIGDADTYTIYRDGQPLTDTTQASHTDTGLTPATEYTYTLTATNPSGTSEASEPVAATTDTPPPPPVTPTGLTATAVGTDQVDLTWDPIGDADTYTIYRDGQPLTDTTQASHTDTGLTPTTEYTYTLTATNPSGTSEASDPVAATTNAPPVIVDEFIVSGDTWRYNDLGLDLGTDWTNTTFDDTTWQSGASELGYGDGDETTELQWGDHPWQKPITYYFRTDFEAGSDLSDVTTVRLRARVDDAAVVYINAVEVWRYNLPDGPVAFDTPATTYVAGSSEQKWREFDVPVSAFTTGTNQVSVEVHQNAPSSSDLTFDLEIHPVR